MKYCSNCGAVMGDSMQKCNSCGADFDDMAVKPETTVAPDEADVSSQAAAEVDNTPTLDLGEENFVKPPEFPEDAQETDTQNGHVNLTQQAINDRKQQQTYNQTANNNSYNQNPGQSGSQYGQTSSGGTGNGGSGKTSFFDNFKNPNGEVTGTVGLIISIIALALVVIFGLIGTCGGAPTVGLIFVIIGIILSVVGLVISNKDRRATGDTCSFAKTAFILSLIALILGVILLIIGISCLGCLACVACRGLGALNSLY